MAKKKRTSIVGRLENTVGDMANALSIAATGSEIGILELAAEDELAPRRPRIPVRPTKTAAKKNKKSTVAKKPRKSARKKRVTNRRKHR